MKVRGSPEHFTLRGMEQKAFPEKNALRFSEDSHNDYKLPLASTLKMVEKQTGPDWAAVLSDMNTRLRESDERGKLVRERILLLGKNLVAIKTESEEELRHVKREVEELKRELEKQKRISNNLLQELSRFVKRDETVLIERLLKDFQPLEFVRKSEVEETVRRMLAESSKKHINTGETP